MDVNNVRGLAGSSGQVVDSSTARPQGRVVEEVQAVGNSPVNALARPQAAASSTLVGGDRGLILYRDGKSYIRGGEGPIAVSTPDGWKSVWMSDPDRPGGVPLRWHCGHWRIDDTAMGKVTSPLDWLKYKLIGKQPPEHSELNPELANMVLEPFVIPPGPDRDFLEKWLVHDWLNALPDHKGGKSDGSDEWEWPDWAIQYAKEDRVVLRGLVRKLLDGEVFPCEAAIMAYAREMRGLDKTNGNSALIHRFTQGFDTASLFECICSEAGSIPAKTSHLVEAREFAHPKFVYEYLQKFSFPETTDGDVLKLALLSGLRDGGRTPAWARHYVELTSWKDYCKEAGTMHRAKRERALTRMLAFECFGFSFARAEAYLAQFAIRDAGGVPIWPLLEDLVLDRILDGGKWSARAFPDGPPRARLN